MLLFVYSHHGGTSSVCMGGYISKYGGGKENVSGFSFIRSIFLLYLLVLYYCVSFSKCSFLLKSSPSFRYLFRNRSFLRIPVAPRPRFSSLRSLRLAWYKVVLRKQYCALCAILRLDNCPEENLHGNCNDTMQTAVLMAWVCNCLIFITNLCFPAYKYEIWYCALFFFDLSHHLLYLFSWPVKTPSIYNSHIPFWNMVCKLHVIYCS